MLYKHLVTRDIYFLVFEDINKSEFINLNKNTLVTINSSVRFMYKKLTRAEQKQFDLTNFKQTNPHLFI